MSADHSGVPPLARHRRIRGVFAVDEKSGEMLHTKKNQWVRIDPKDHAELSNEFYDLISTAYADIGGHSKINSPDDVFSDPDWTFWKGVDLHDSPDVDLVVWGRVHVMVARLQPLGFRPGHGV